MCSRKVTAPWISCIMVTRNRPHFVSGAIADFLRQDYPHKELVIIDDGEQPIAGLVPPDPAMRYVRLREPRPVGTKRNLACALARGEIVTHWDDDDFSAPDRLSHTVAAFASRHVQLAGLGSALYFDLDARQAHRFCQPAAQRSWLPMLSYRHGFWRRHPFADVSVGEDNRFVAQARRDQVGIIEGADLQVFAIHGSNVAAKRTDGPCWRAAEPHEVEAAIRDGARLASWGKGSAEAPSVPRISVIFPAHAAGAELVARSVQALRAQTLPYHAFEVVVAADGESAYEPVLAAVQTERLPFACRVICSPRPRGDISHRNHARNAGARAARGEWVWFLDGDSLVEPCALEHLVHELEAAAPGDLRVLSPILMEIASSPEDWLATSGRWIERAAYHELATAHELPINRWFYSGFEWRHLPGPPCSEACPQMREGYPAMARALWEALDGFDEHFVGWGGEKEDLVRKILSLAPVLPVEMRLVRSVRVLHQPHQRDPGATLGHAESSSNYELFVARQEGVQHDAAWWRRTKRRVAALCAAHGTPELGPAESRLPGRRAQVTGIVCSADPAGGLLRDAEALRFALGDAEACLIFACPGLSHTRSLGLAASAASVHAGDATFVQAGSTLRSLCERVDTLVLLEVFSAEVADHAHALGKRVVYVPNLEVSCVYAGIDAWRDSLLARPWLDVWAKSREAGLALERAGIAAWTIPWSIPDVVVRERSSRPAGPVRLLVNAGRGGARDLRGLDLALRAFALARAENDSLELCLKCCGPLPSSLEPLLAQPGVEVVEQLLPREELEGLYERADALLVASRAEGLGLPILEAAHRGLPVIAPDGWPMNEQVAQLHDALLVKAACLGEEGLAPRWEVQVDALAQAIVRFAGDRELRERLTCPHPAALEARQRAFGLRVRRRVTGCAMPRVVLFYEGLRGNRRDGEWFWAEALRRHGYDVEYLAFSAAGERMREALARPHDFVLAANVPTAIAREIRRASSAPLVLWHHDYMDMFAERRAWFDAVSRIVDVIFLPDAVNRPAQAEQHTLLPGAMITGDRGLMLRPRFMPPVDSGPSALFVGNALAEDPRVVAIRKLVFEAGLEIYGDPASWQVWGLRCQGRVRGEDADALHRRAQVTLSISRARGTPYYTSDRLFNAAAMGACLAVERFPGIDELYPAGSLALFDGPEDVTQVVKTLQGDAARRNALREAAMTHTWRHHTVEDRLSQMLDRLERWIDECEPVKPVERSHVRPEAPQSFQGELSRWSRRRVPVGRRNKGTPQIKRLDGP